MPISLKQQEQLLPMPKDNISVLEARDHTDISYSLFKSSCNIRKVDQTHYVIIPSYVHNLSKGEKEIEICKIVSDMNNWKEFSNQLANRSNNINAVRYTMKNLRNIINENVTHPENCLFLTLTYAENMTDSNRLYKDIKNFMARFRYYLNKNNHPSFEYINTIEPQGRGAFHAHCILIFPEQAPFIPASEIERIWRNGFIKIQSVSDSVDNIGAYLTAYLTDLNINDVSLTDLKKVSTSDIKEISNGGERKAYVKGQRLALYPKGINIYRCSKGIKIPQVQKCDIDRIAQLIRGRKLTYKYAFSIHDTTTATKNINVINKLHYVKHKTAPEISTTEEIITPIFTRPISLEIYIQLKICVAVNDYQGMSPELVHEYIAEFEIENPDLSMTDKEIQAIIND